jgi:hypothetical protein
VTPDRVLPGMTPAEEAEKTLSAVCEFLDNPPQDPAELDRQRFNLSTQVERLRALVEREGR